MAAGHRCGDQVVDGEVEGWLVEFSGQVAQLLTGTFQLQQQ